METKYTIDEWNEALETARANYFNGVDSEEEGGPLAAWLCEMYTHETVRQNRQNPDILEAVICVVEESGPGAFSQERFRTILKSFRGDTVADFAELTEEYLSDNHDLDLSSLPGSPDQDDYEVWYLRNAVSETETFAETSAGGTFYWFDKAKW